MPNKQEAVEMRMKAIEEALEEVEKVEHFLKKGAVKLYTDIITPDIEHCANDNLFSDMEIIRVVNQESTYLTKVKKFFEVTKQLNLKRIEEYKFSQFLLKKDDPILFFKKEESETILYRKSYLQEIVEKDGYELEYDKEEEVITILIMFPRLIKDENGKVLIKRD